MNDPLNPRAFPSAAIDDRFGGMLLWDHFAGQAIAGLTSACDTAGAWQTIGSEENIAIHAANIAGAMLAERAKRFPMATQ